MHYLVPIIHSFDRLRVDIRDELAEFSGRHWLVERVDHVTGMGVRSLECARS
jgi:hypothetical protein